MSSAEIPSELDASLPGETRPAGERKPSAPAIEATLDYDAARDGSEHDIFSLQPEQTVGDFQIVRLLGSGGYAQVYLARQLSLDRLVALKVSRPDGGEGQTLAQLDHPHIVPVYSEQIVEGRKLLAMRYIPGRTLEHWIAWRASKNKARWKGAELLAWLAESIERRPTEQPEIHASELALLAFVPAVCRLVLDIARGLDHAHRRGVVHRDIKPANVLLDPAGRALLMDFNVADRGKPEDLFGGTLAYMAPEHLAAFDTHLPGNRADVDERSDIYSLGLLFYELLASQYPFTTSGGASDFPAQIRWMLAERLRGVPQLPTTVGRVPDSVRSMLAKCLAPRKEDRYLSVAALVEDLERFLRHEPLAHAPDRSVWEGTVRWFRRRPRRSAAMGVIGLVMVAGTMAAGYSDLTQSGRAAEHLDQCQQWLGAGQLGKAAETLRQAEIALDRENWLLPASWTTHRRAVVQEKFKQTAGRFAQGELERFRESLRRARTESWTGRFTDAATDPLAVFHVLEREDWQRIPPYRLLSAGERIEVDAAIAEMLLTRASRFDAAHLDTLDARLGREALLARLPVSHRDRPLAVALRKMDETQGRVVPDTERLAGQCRDAFDWYLLGIISAQRGAYDEALNFLDAALRAGTANEEERFWTNFARAVCLHWTQRHAEAISAYGVCLGLRSGFAWTHYNLGLVYLKVGENELASREFERAYQLDARLGIALAEWGVALFQQGKFEDSLAKFDEAVSQGVETARVLTNRAAAKAALEDWTGAQEDLQQALAIDPGYEAAKENLRKLKEQIDPSA